MTRTDVVASSRPRNPGAIWRTGACRACRRLSVVPIALLLAAALLGPQAASAAESTSGYSQTVPTPKTTTTPATTPTTGTSPSKEEKTSPEKTTPAKETSPTSSTPTSTTSTEKASTLPFTGFDLRWSLGIGLLLIGAGFSLVMVERRQRRRTTR
jgi:hypothetical protein